MLDKIINENIDENINDITNNINDKINNLKTVVHPTNSLLDINIVRNIFVDIQKYSILGISLIDDINNKKIIKK